MTANAKFLLVSILFMSILVPAAAAATKDPRKGLKRALVGMSVFNLLYVLALTYIYPRLL